MTTITWQIEWMQASTQTINGFSEVVLTAGWRCNGTDGTYNASNYGTCSFPEPTTGGQFTPYAQLTQAQVLGWCYANGVNQSEVETNVTQAVATLANPPVVNPPLPWASQAA
jgi:hypothetical protein